MSANTQFVIIDDNKLNCFIAEKMIKKLSPDIVVKPFIYANEGFEYIKEKNNYDKSIILIDIQMPLMSGFNFVDAYEALPEEIKNQYLLYIYSSTINESDKMKANGYKSVRHFFSKPLTHNSITILIKELNDSLEAVDHSKD